MRVCDQHWKGEHLGVPHPGSSFFHPAGSRVRKNAALPAGLDVYIGGGLKKGQTPKKIFNDLVGKKYDKLSVEGKRQVIGLEESEKLVGFKFRQLQWWATRFRHTLSTMGSSYKACVTCGCALSRSSALLKYDILLKSYLSPTR